MKSTDKSVVEVKTLRSNTIFGLCLVYLFALSGIFLVFGKDYLIDSGKLIFTGVVIFGAAFFGFILTKAQLKLLKLATELRRTAEEEEFERNRTLTLINSIKDGVILVDDSGYVSLYNAATLDILDTNVGISRQKVSKVFNPAPGSDFDIDKVMMNLRGSQDLNLKNVRPTGEAVDLSLTVSRARSGYGKIGTRGFVLVIRQTSASSAGVDANVSKLIHDLRNNLTVVEGSIENAGMMLQTKNVEGAKKALNAATEAVRKVKQAVLK
jgi:signal transduction histidine kinase